MASRCPERFCLAASMSRSNSRSVRSIRGQCGLSQVRIIDDFTLHELTFGLQEVL